MERRRFEDHLVAKPRPKGIDVATKLEHFAIITYAVDPERFEGVIPERFRLRTVEIAGRSKALLSVVPFMDTDFRLAAYPYAKARMGQTNYRIYVEDRYTGEDVVWFLGTVLDSWAVVVPRNVWKLPWHRGTIRFTCQFDPKTGLYERLDMRTDSTWAPAELSLVQEGESLSELNGFPDTETGLFILTHPLIGFYHRRDGKLGTYRVWHDRLEVKTGKLISAYFGLLERLQLVSKSEQSMPHSVLITPETQFIISLPPSVIG